MIKFIKRHWILIIIGFIILFLAYGGIDGLIAKYKYKKQIKEKDVAISELWVKIGDSKKREAKWENQATENYALAIKREAKIRKKDAEMRIKLAEKRALKKIIKEMPITQVVVRTIEIINCPDVVHQEQGIVFTLDCAKNNLIVLENVFYFKKEALDWADQFFTSQAEVSDLKNVIINKDGVIKEVRDQIIGEDKIIIEWTDKFNLSEKRGKAKWWKGIKTGAVVGAALVILIKLAF